MLNSTIIYFLLFNLVGYKHDLIRELQGMVRSEVDDITKGDITGDNVAGRRKKLSRVREQG